MGIINGVLLVNCLNTWIADCHLHYLKNENLYSGHKRWLIKLGWILTNIVPLTPDMSSEHPDP